MILVAPTRGTARIRPIAPQIHAQKNSDRVTASGSGATATRRFWIKNIHRDGYQFGRRRSRKDTSERTPAIVRNGLRRIYRRGGLNLDLPLKFTRLRPMANLVRLTGRSVATCRDLSRPRRGKQKGRFVDRRKYVGRASAHRSATTRPDKLQSGRCHTCCPRLPSFRRPARTRGERYEQAAGARRGG